MTYHGLSFGLIRILLFVLFQGLAYHFYAEALVLNFSLNRYPPEADSLGIPLTAFLLAQGLLAPCVLAIACLPGQLVRLKGTRPFAALGLISLLLICYALLLGSALIHLEHAESEGNLMARSAAAGPPVLLFLWLLSDVIRCRPRRTDRLQYGK